MDRLTGKISPKIPWSGESLAVKFVQLSVYSKRFDKLHARQVIYAVRLGTFNRHHRGSEDTIAFAYKEVKTPREKEEVPNLDVVRDRLLVPSSVTSKGSGYSIEGIEPP